LENTSINKVSIDGEVTYNGPKEKFEKVINIAGPWAYQLLKDSNIDSDYELDLV
tara:strand:+ start:1380 stop:1541 length:162 start_codon:yes stop_codon:yes gene_type:complete